MPEPISHVFIFDNIIKNVFGFVIFQYFKKSGSESTFRIGGGSLNEDDDGAAVENGLYFGMPDSFILFELIFVFLSNGGEGLKNGSNII